MSKTKVFAALAAATATGVALTALTKHAHHTAPAEVASTTPLTTAEPIIPAPTPSQRVPRPGRPRPQMRAAGSQHPVKRVH